jgi:hypothetical protein
MRLHHGEDAHSNVNFTLFAIALSHFQCRSSRFEPTVEKGGVCVYGLDVGIRFYMIDKWGPSPLEYLIFSVQVDDMIDTAGTLTKAHLS